MHPVLNVGVLFLPGGAKLNWFFSILQSSTKKTLSIAYPLSGEYHLQRQEVRSTKPSIKKDMGSNPLHPARIIVPLAGLVSCTYSVHAKRSRHR